MNRINTQSPLAVYDIATSGSVRSGMIACFDSAGKLVPGADTAGLLFAGVVKYVDYEANTAEIETGCFAFVNDTVNPVARTHRNQAAFVATSIAVASTGNVPAGIVVDVYDGEVYLDCDPAAVAAATPPAAAP